MKQHPESEDFIDEYLKNVPQEVWRIAQMCFRAVREKNAQALERQLAEIEAAIRAEGLRQALERGSEPFWMQDIRLAQRRIDARRAALAADRARSRPAQSE